MQGGTVLGRVIGIVVIVAVVIVIVAVVVVAVALGLVEIQDALGGIVRLGVVGHDL